MSDRPRAGVAVVIPNWNGDDFLAQCLTSLAKQSYRDFDTIVVDNGSVDGSKKILAEQFPDVRVIELDRNYGFAGGVNRGIQPAIDEGYWAIALFNNDAVAHEHWLAELVKGLEGDDKVGFVTSRFLSLNGKTVDSTGDFYSIWGLPFPRDRGEPSPTEPGQPQPVFGASGGASLYRAGLFRQIGLFDEDFFAYFEDIDLSFRARLAGWQALYIPTAVVYHHIGGTSSRVSGLARFHSTKNMYFVYTKNMPGKLYWKYLGLFWLGMSLVGFNSLRTGQIKPQLKAWAVALVMFPKMLAKRRHIQAKRTVSIEEIDQLLYHALPPTQIKTIRRFARIPGLKKFVKTADETTTKK